MVITPAGGDALTTHFQLSGYSIGGSARIYKKTVGNPTVLVVVAANSYITKAEGALGLIVKEFSAISATYQFTVKSSVGTDGSNLSAGINVRFGTVCDRPSVTYQPTVMAGESTGAIDVEDPGELGIMTWIGISPAEPTGGEWQAADGVTFDPITGDHLIPLDDIINAGGFRLAADGNYFDGYATLTIYGATDSEGADAGPPLTIQIFVNQVQGASKGAAKKLITLRSLSVAHRAQIAAYVAGIDDDHEPRKKEQDV